MLLVVAVGAHAQSVPKDATNVFAQYVALEAKFDATVADLYADDAVIKNTRRNRDGTAHTTTLPAATYKELIRKSMPAAKARKDTNQYSSVRFKLEDGKVRVTATRYSDSKKYSSPISLLIAQRSGRWLIVEEISESVAITVNLGQPIRQLKLSDGRTLNNVFVTSVAADHVSAQWRGGRGNIAFELLPDEYREAAIAMRTPKPARGAAPATGAEKKR